MSRLVRFRFMIDSLLSFQNARATLFPVENLYIFHTQVISYDIIYRERIVWYCFKTKTLAEILNTKKTFVIYFIAEK